MPSLPFTRSVQDHTCHAHCSGLVPSTGLAQFPSWMQDLAQEPREPLSPPCFSHPHPCFPPPSSCSSTHLWGLLSHLSVPEICPRHCPQPLDKAPGIQPHQSWPQPSCGHTPDRPQASAQPLPSVYTVFPTWQPGKVPPSLKDPNVASLDTSCRWAASPPWAGSCSPHTGVLCL